MSHVRSGSRIDGDGGVVGCHILKTTGRHGRTCVVGDRSIASS